MKKRMDRRNFIKLGLFGGVSALVASYPFFIERYLFQVNTYHVPVKKLPGVFHGFTIVQLTDLHYGFLMPLSVIKKVLHTVSSLKKDMIVCTGDYSHGKNNTKQLDIIWSELHKLRARHGVYSILGNHDHWADFERSLYWINRSGQNVRHKAVQIKRGGERIWLGGAGDLWEDDVGIDKAFQNVPSEECKILLAHNPDTADTTFNTRIDLIISGHTHGGQVKFPVLGTPILPVNNKKYASGFIRTKNTHLYISRGIGWAIIPVRFNCFPEISVLRLVSEI